MCRKQGGHENDAMDTTANKLAYNSGRSLTGSLKSTSVLFCSVSSKGLLKKNKKYNNNKNNNKKNYNDNNNNTNKNQNQTNKDKHKTKPNVNCLQGAVCYFPTWCLMRNMHPLSSG